MIDTVRKLLALFTRRQRLLAAGVLGVMVLMGIMQLVGVGSILPFVSLLSNPESVHENPWLSWAYEAFGFSDTRSYLIFLGSLALAAVVLSNAVLAIGQWVMVKFTWATQHRLSRQLLERYLAQPYAAFLNRNSADAGKNILQETQMMANGFLLPLLQVCAFGFSALMILGFLVALHPALASIVAVVLGGGYALIYGLIRRKLSAIGAQRMWANTQRFKAVNEAFGGIKEVKAMGKEPRFVGQYIGPSQAFKDAMTLQNVLSQVPRYLIEALGFGAMLAIVLYLMAIEGDVRQIIPIVSVYAFAGYRMLPALQRVYKGISQVRFNHVVVDTIYADMTDGGTSLDGMLQGPLRSERLPFEDEIRLDEVTFTYPGAEVPALREINLTIPKGNAVAFAGETGAGKTTLADVILGLLRPDHGIMAVDGVEVHEGNLRNWQNNLGYVPQEIYLSDSTIASNIAFGVPHAQIDHDAVEVAARIANVHQFMVEELPDGYETVVGERGVRLSGGQRQRIGIARALYHDPEVLVLDEATNALDSTTEDAVLKAIEQVAQVKTLIMIAHRLTTVKECDMVYLLDQGEIISEGSYDDLLANDERFRRMAAVAS
ncbi:MAG: ABC transporter ATP-binding protein [Salinibacter sp.]